MSFHNMNEEDFGSDDSNDEDYVPCDGVPQVSEEEDSGDDEGKVLVDDEEDGKEKLGKKRRKTTTTKKTKKSIGKEEILPAKEQTPEKEKLSEEQDKKRADMLWADFMKDVGGPVKSSNGETTQTTKAATPSPAQRPEKVTIVKEFNFAGETVKVSTEVDADSKEAGEEKVKAATSQIQPSSSSSSPSILNNRKRESSGLSGLLDKLQKKPKMSILDKSKLDWNSFKSSAGITEELQQHNRGKNGYLEKVAFLERADYKQYEIERDMRTASRKPT